MKTGGREPGTENLLTRDMRATLKQIINKELETMAETLEKMEPGKRLEITLRLLPFVLPKVDSVKMQTGEPLESFDWSVQ